MRIAPLAGLFLFSLCLLLARPAPATAAVAQCAPPAAGLPRVITPSTSPASRTCPTSGALYATGNVWSNNAFTRNVWAPRGVMIPMRPGAGATGAGPTGAGQTGAGQIGSSRLALLRSSNAQPRNAPATECLVIGDSIAVGVGMARPDCVTIARVGISAGRYVAELLRPGRARIIVISLGVNDGPDEDTLRHLREVRHSLAGGNVYWLLPGIRDRARKAIRTVAGEFKGDRLIDTRAQAGPDHLHPTMDGYRLIAGRTLGMAKHSAPGRTASLR